MFDIVLEVIRSVVLLIIFINLWMAGKRRVELSRQGWTLLLAGFALLLFGSLIDLTDNFTFLNQFVVIGDTPTQAFIEKLIGYLGGFLLIAMGLVMWIPTVTSVDSIGHLNDRLAGQAEVLQFREVELTELAEELARVNEQLDRERTLLSTLVENMPDAIYFKDKQSRFIRANPGACKIFGASSEDAVLGRTDADFFDAEEAKEYCADEQHIIVTGEPLIGKEEHERWQDGRMHWVLTTKMPLHDHLGNIVGTFGISRDITKQKEVEAALRQSEERFDLAARGSNDGLWDWHIASGSEWWSPRFCELLGFADSEIEATYVAFQELLHPDDKQRTIAAVTAHLDDQVPYDIEFRLRTKSGDYRWFSARGQALWGDNGAPARMAGSIRDITDRIRAEETLQVHARDLAAANRDLQEFAFVVSHDLREPLRAISGFCSLLQREYQSLLDEQGQDFVQRIIDGASRMRDLLDGLLAYSRVGTHGATLEQVNLNEVLDTALANLDAAIRESNANVAHVSLPTLRCDKTQLVQIFQNLIANAIKYRSQSDPQIDIGVASDGALWQFSVRDNGIGFDPNHGGRIYEIFQRLHTHDEYSGIGVGLAICKRIVQRHGGRIWSESEPGVGSTFYFTIPENDQ